jgi:hypothetical protein
VQQVTDFVCVIRFPEESMNKATPKITIPATAPATAPASDLQRKPWVAPKVSVLPVAQTNDGGKHHKHEHS